MFERHIRWGIKGDMGMYALKLTHAFNSGNCTNGEAHTLNRIPVTQCVHPLDGLPHYFLNCAFARARCGSAAACTEGYGDRHSTFNLAP